MAEAQKLRNDLVTVITPHVITENERRNLVNDTFHGITALQNRIDYSGDPHMFAGQLINKTLQYTPPVDGKIATVCLLETVKKRVGTDQQPHIDKLIALTNANIAILATAVAPDPREIPALIMTLSEENRQLDADLATLRMHLANKNGQLAAEQNAAQAEGSSRMLPALLYVASLFLGVIIALAVDPIIGLVAGIVLFIGAVIFSKRAGKQDKGGTNPQIEKLMGEIAAIKRKTKAKTQQKSSNIQAITEFKKQLKGQ